MLKGPDGCGVRTLSFVRAGDAARGGPNRLSAPGRGLIATVNPQARKAPDFGQGPFFFCLRWGGAAQPPTALAAVVTAWLKSNKALTNQKMMPATPTRDA